MGVAEVTKGAAEVVANLHACKDGRVLRLSCGGYDYGDSTGEFVEEVIGGGGGSDVGVS